MLSNDPFYLNLNRADKLVREGKWIREGNRGVELMGKTVGLVGAGFIGQEIAKRVIALGMKVIAFDPYAKADQLAKLSIKSVELDQLAKMSDFVVMAAKMRLAL